MKKGMVSTYAVIILFAVIFIAFLALFYVMNDSVTYQIDFLPNLFN